MIEDVILMITTGTTLMRVTPTTIEGNNNNTMHLIITRIMKEKGHGMTKDVVMLAPH